MQETATATPTSLSLALPEIDEIKNAVVPVSAAQAAQADPSLSIRPLDPQMEALADQFVSAVLSLDPDAIDQQRKQRAEVDGLGVDLQKQAAHRSAMLQKPIADLASRGADGGPVASALIDLKVQMDQLNPNEIDFSVSGIAKAFSWLPGVGSTVQEYFLRYETAQGIIDQIIKSLKAGKDTLGRDNITLAEDQDVMRKLTLALDQQIVVAQAIDRKLESATAELAEGQQKRFLSDEIIFPLRQRIQDLQQQLAVNQQGILATEIVIRNNRELMRGVDRAINVTVSALTVAVTVALALANQKLVLDKIEALNKTTDTLIAGTAAKLRSQGVDIHNQASATMLDMETLKAAFRDIMGAMDEISRYRREALPKMAAQILEMEQLTRQGEETIQRMERGNAAAATVINATNS